MKSGNGREKKINPSTEPTFNFSLLEKETKKLISSRYCKYFKPLADKLKKNPKKFWSFRAVKSKSKRLPEVVRYASESKSAKNPTGKAHLFNEFFSTLFTKIVPVHMEFLCDVIQPDLLLQFSTSRNQVKDTLTKLDIIKSTSVNGISARVLKECAVKLSYPLTLLFNLSFQIGKVPVSRKRANVTPVFNSDAKEKVENYRPISLLSIPAKCQERIERNATHSRVAPYLTKWQHGFVRGRSCATQLVLSHHQWSKP